MKSTPVALPALLLCLLSCAALSQQVAPQPAGPKPRSPIQFESEDVDLGSIREENGPVKGKVKFKNAGKTSVTVKSVTSTCGCTVVSVAAKSYAPGEEGEVQVEYNPAMRQGKDRKPIHVETDFADNPITEAYLLVNVIPMISIEPRAIWFGEFKRNEKSEPKKVVVTSRAKDFEIKKADSSDPRFVMKHVSRDETKVDGDAATADTYEIVFTGDKDVCILQTQATFETSDKKVPTFNIPLVGRVVGDLRFVPDTISLRLEKIGEPFEQVIQVSSRTNAPFKITASSATARDDMSLTVTEEPGDPKVPQIRILKLKGTTPGLDAKTGNTFSGTLTIKTDLEDQPVATLPITGFVVLPPAQPVATTTGGH